jgi:hypothetical protein
MAVEKDSKTNERKSLEKTKEWRLYTEGQGRMSCFCDIEEKEEREEKTEEEKQEEENCNEGAV